MPQFYKRELGDAGVEFIFGEELRTFAIA